MKQTSKVRCKASRNREVLRRYESPMATSGRSGHSTPHAPREGIHHAERDEYVVPSGRSGHREKERIFLTSGPNTPPEKRVWDFPVGRNLDKVSQTWPKLAKTGHRWPKLDKAGQIWTAGGQVFQPLCGAMHTRQSVKQKTLALFSRFRKRSTSAEWERNGQKSAPRTPSCPRLARCRSMAAQRPATSHAGLWRTRFRAGFPAILRTVEIGTIHTNPKR